MTDSTSVNLLALCRHSRKLLCIATSGQGMPTGAEPTRTSLAQWCQKVLSRSQEVFFTVTIRLTYAEMRADERTRTAFLLITNDNSCVAGVCTSLQILHR